MLPEGIVVVTLLIDVPDSSSMEQDPRITKILPIKTIKKNKFFITTSLGLILLRKNSLIAEAAS